MESREANRVRLFPLVELPFRLILLYVLRFHVDKPPRALLLGLYLASNKRRILIAPPLFTNSISSTRGGERAGIPKKAKYDWEEEKKSGQASYIGSPASFYLSLQPLDFPLHINFSFQSVTRRSYLFSDPFLVFFLLLDPSTRTPFLSGKTFLLLRRPSPGGFIVPVYAPSVSCRSEARGRRRRRREAYTRARLSCIHVDGN